MKPETEKWVVKEARRRKHLLEEINTIETKIRRYKRDLKELKKTLSNLDDKLLKTEEL